MGKVYVGDVGTRIILAVGTTITGGTVSMLVRKPFGVIVPWTATIGSDDSSIYHDAASGDFNEPGMYVVQAVVALADGSWSGRGAEAQFKVYP